MSLAAGAISSDVGLAEIIVEASADLATLTPVERVRYHFHLIMAFRRFEAVHVQSVFGSIDPDRTRGVERSLISILAAAKQFRRTTPWSSSSDRRPGNPPS